MSKAVFLDQTGGADAFCVRDHDPGEPGAGEIRVKNTAVGLNFIDIYQRQGLYPVSLPAILGSEAAGIVEAAGEGASFSAGDRVAYITGAGAYSEATIVPSAVAASIPDSIDDDTAAAVFLKGLTAEMLLRQVFALGPDHACLIYAAAGGVGTILTQWACAIGADVIGVVGSSDKATAVKTFGARDTIIRTETESIANDVRRLTSGRGVDVVYDSVGEATFEASLDSLAMRGHMVTYGNASGPVPAVQPLELSRRGSLTLTRPSLFHYATPDRLPDMARALFDVIGSGAVNPHIGHRFALDEIADAHHLLESGESSGAIILKP
ncbi:MAG: quinone oxidoreductase [Pseudomonadota bacterium]